MAEQAGYETLEDAAAAARMAINKLEKSRMFEYAAVLYQDPNTGRYFFTAPEGQGDNGSFKITATIPKGSLRGIYHNHPPEPPGGHKSNNSLRDLFSPADVEVSNQLGVKSFIGVDEDLLEFDPSSRGNIRRVKINGKRERAGEGTPVLARIPIDQLGESLDESKLQLARAVAMRGK